MDDVVFSKKRDMAKQFFKDAVWIDNEIIDCLDETTPAEMLEKHFSLFVSLGKELLNIGVNCSLCSFGEQSDSDPFSENDDEKRACQIAEQSDLIILDWHMVGNECEPCLRVLSHLEKSGGVHFVLIFTQEETSDVDVVLTQKVGTYRHLGRTLHYANVSNSVYIVVISKHILRTLGNHATVAQHLVEEMCNLLIESYPDVLRWSALSVASSIKRCVPQWMSLLPSDTDVGVALDYYLNSDDGVASAVATVREMILGNVLDDLAAVLKSKSSRHLPDEILNSRIQEISSKINDGIRKETSSLSPKLQNQTVSFELNKTVKSGVVKKLTDFISNNEGDYQSIKQYISGCNSYAKYSELISGPIPTEILRGNIYKSPSCDKMCLCVSQACDCVRSEFLLMLVCETAHMPSQKDSLVFRCIDDACEIKLKVSSIEVISRKDLCDQYTCIGRLRNLIVDRLAHQFISHISRVGVDIPSYERALRKN